MTDRTKILHLGDMQDEIIRLQARVKVLEDALHTARTHVANNAQGWGVGRGASRDDLSIVDAALAASQPADPVTNAGCCQPVKVKHVNRGSSYLVVGAGKVQTETPLRDYDDVVVYQGETDGLIWVRPTTEFEDGRFVALEAAPRVNETPKCEHDSADVLTALTVTPAPDPANVQALVDALEFYADRDNYEPVYERMPCDCCTEIYEPVKRDEGDTARAALAAWKEATK